MRMTRSTIVLAWHAWDSCPELASVTLGIHSSVVSLIREIKLERLDEIANRHFPRLMPRWEDRPIAWKHLLDTVLAAETNETQSFNIHGLLLTAGEHPPGR
jgi:hypothetical protein